jgi:signal transduction histidine kinase
MNENDYLLAWGAYAFAALGCLLVWFKLTGWMWRWLREPLRLIVAVLLFTPTISDPLKEQFAPAIAIMALDILFKVGNNAWRALSDLALYGAIAFIGYLVLAGIRWPIERWWRARQTSVASSRSGTADSERDERSLRERLASLEDERQGDIRRDGNGGHRLRIEPRL